MEAEQVPDVLTEIHRWRRSLSEMPPATTEEEAIDRITALEELNSASAAAQARETLTFDMLRRNREAEDGVASKKQGRGLGAEVALARKVSRSRGAALLKFSRTLLMDLPKTYQAMKGGDISEEKARVVAKESGWLPREKRQELDERMAERLPEVGVRRLGNEVRALAQRLDQRAAVDHLERCVEERSVSVRPAPGNMAYLTALLPMPEAVAAFANLTKSAQSVIATGDAGGRSQGQIAADLLVERVTGQESAAAVPTEVHLIMQASSLFEPGEESAWFPGVGPIPAQVARDFVAENDAAVFLRRLYTRPEDGQLVRMDSRRREFSGLLRRMVVLRDDVCRSPWCEAPIKQADHVVSFASGGDTDWENSSGLCAACNYAKELSGWRHNVTPDALEVVTPTGHRYRSRTKPISEPDPGLAHGEVVGETAAPPGIPAGTGPPGIPVGTGPPGTSAGTGPPNPAVGSDPPSTDPPATEPGTPPPTVEVGETTTPADGGEGTPPDVESGPALPVATAGEGTPAATAPRSSAPASGEVSGADGDNVGDQQWQIHLPWRYLRRAEQPPPLRLGRTTVSVDVYDADFEPLSPVEELLLTGIREHLGSR
ncbi:DUF222 domain-containing protein [Brevibacterium oceani]|uniref:HNH endonuclease signature motif containing protein n=1 Tax=Brevibacterium oceani TaxID=358099 RepID=UPI001FE92D22|nr:DUF222 domain-containing protein [Brevibacterium oceani]